MAKDKILIDLHFLGSIAYYTKLLEYQEVIFERNEYFVRASYRNRCKIAGPNGLNELSVQIKKGRKLKRLYTDVQLAYEHRWHKIHWHTLESNYRCSPYFEYYEDHFAPFFKTEYSHLYDFNLALFQLINKLLQLNIKISFTDTFQKNAPEDVDDYRGYFMPNKTVANFTPPEYIQVFSNKIGFLPNMSIIDLLFCEGPHAIKYLKKE